MERLGLLWCLFRILGGHLPFLGVAGDTLVNLLLCSVFEQLFIFVHFNTSNGLFFSFVIIIFARCVIHETTSEKQSL